MKRFLFDTWYGALALWGGACVVFLAFPALDVFLPGRLPRALDVCLGRTSFVLALLSGILFFVAWLVSLARRRWRRALLQAFLGLGLLVCVLCAFFAILIAADLGVGISEDHFADSLTIPPEMEAGLVVPGEPGMTYLRAFEATKGTPLSESGLKEDSNERIGWSDEPEEKFLYENEFMIHEGDWGKPYAARIEVWFRPDSGKPERKLLERICKIEGWQR